MKFICALMIVIAIAGFLFGVGQQLLSESKDAYIKKSLERYPSIAELNEAIKKDPSNVRNYADRAFELALLNDNQGAVADFTVMIQLESDLAPAYLGRGLARWSLGARTEAMEDFNEAIRLSPNTALCYRIRASRRFDLGDFQGGLDDLVMAYKIGSAR